MSERLIFEAEPLEAYSTFETDEEEQPDTATEFDTAEEEFDAEPALLEWEEEARRGRGFAGRRAAPRLRTPPRRRQPRNRPRAPKRRLRAVIRRRRGPRVVVREPSIDDRPPEGTEHIRWVQSSLNAILDLQLPVDGVMGLETRSAVRSFQRREGLPEDGIVGPQVEAALVRLTQSRPPGEEPEEGGPEEEGFLSPVRDTVGSMEYRRFQNEGGAMKTLLDEMLTEGLVGPAIEGEADSSGRAAGKAGCANCGGHRGNSGRWIRQGKRIAVLLGDDTAQQAAMRQEVDFDVGFPSSLSFESAGTTCPLPSPLPTAGQFADCPPHGRWYMPKRGDNLSAAARAELKARGAANAVTVQAYLQAIRTHPNNAVFARVKRDKRLARLKGDVTDAFLLEWSKRDGRTHVGRPSGGYALLFLPTPGSGLVYTATSARAALVNGNARWQPKWPSHRRFGIECQEPHTTVLSCSDSRVPPEFIFDQDVGDIFTIRTAGQVFANCDAVEGTLEYAATTLCTPLFVVLGHSDCGAVKKAVGISSDCKSPYPCATGSDESLQRLGDDIKKRLTKRGVFLQTPPTNTNALDQYLALCIKENAKGIAEELKAHLTRLKLPPSSLVIAAYYDLKVGKVEWIP